MNVDGLAENMLVEGTSKECFDKEAIEKGFAYDSADKSEILEMIFIEEGSWVLAKMVSYGNYEYKLPVGRSFH